MKHLLLFFVLSITGFINSSDKPTQFRTIRLEVAVTNQTEESFKWGWYPAPSSSVSRGDNPERSILQDSEIAQIVQNLQANIHRDRQQTIAPGEKQSIESSTAISRYATEFEFFVSIARRSKRFTLNLMPGQHGYSKMIQFCPPK